MATPGEPGARRTGSGGRCTPATAVYVPPPVTQMHQCLDDWEKFLHQRGTMPDLVQCALMHEQFEAIHPFLDGNGRVGRLLITLFLKERGRLSQPLLYLSDYIDKHRGDYYDLLLRVRTHGDWDSWLRYFINGVQVTAADAVKRTTHVIEMREDFRKRVGDKVRALALVDQLFTNPYMTVAHAMKALDVTYPTALKVIDLLVERKLIQKLGERRWGSCTFASRYWKRSSRNALSCNIAILVDSGLGQRLQRLPDPLRHRDTRRKPFGRSERLPLAVAQRKQRMEYITGYVRRVPARSRPRQRLGDLALQLK